MTSSPGLLPNDTPLDLIHRYPYMAAIVFIGLIGRRLWDRCSLYYAMLLGCGLRHMERNGWNE